MDRLKIFKSYLTTTHISSAEIKTTKLDVNKTIIEDDEVKTVEKIRAQTIETSASETDPLTAENNTFFTSLFGTTSPKIKKPTSLARPKFLRSKSSGVPSSISRLKQKSHSSFEHQSSRDSTASTTSATSKKPAQTNEIYGQQLFDLLSADLDKLIRHFKPVNPTKSDDQEEEDIFELTDSSSINYFKLAQHSKVLLDKCVLLYDKIDARCELYDYEDLKSNGYRSLMKIFDSCCRRMWSVVGELNEKKSGFFFNIKLNSTLPSVSTNTILKEFQTWARLMEKIEIVLRMAVDMQSMTEIEEDGEGENGSDGPSLFVNSKKIMDSSIETNLFSLGSAHQDAFFGRACGFQFCESLQMPLTVCAVALASYNDGYEAVSSNKENQHGAVNPVYAHNTMTSSQTISYTNGSSGISVNGSYQASPSSQPAQASIVRSLFSSTKYILDPELRARKISRVMREANVEFCKAFWQLTETSIAQVGSNLMTPAISINLLKKISLSQPILLQKLKTNETIENDDKFKATSLVTVSPPQSAGPNDTIQIRILSSEMRDGMQDLDTLKSADSNPLFNNFPSFQGSKISPKSSCLILHVHGGGFIAHSSKSHEIYLKPWCKELKVPIVSVDYSLAPEHVFPRASEECFYVYAWCLQNQELLGWTGEKIICVGDSAGGVLVTNIVQRAIANNIRLPDALVPIYTPFLLNYSLSPSRLMSVMDPLLNLGILWRCLAAYCGIDFKSETERFKQILNISEKNEKPTKTSPTRNALSRIASVTRTSPIKAFLSRSSSYSSQPSTPNNNPASNDSIDSTPATPRLNESLFNIEPISENGQTSSEKISELSDKHKEHLAHLYKILGDSVFLIEKLRDHPITQNPYMSPLLSHDSVLEKFPKTFLITCTHDPLLDDNIEFNKKLKTLNVLSDLHVLDGLHHGFLNFVTSSKDCLNASKFVANIIKEALDLNETNN